MSADDDNSLKGIIIPPKPQILVDLQTAGDDTNKIASLIEQDPGISASVLKTINSPYFGIPNKVTSIHKAVLLLGIGSITNIVNALSLKFSLPGNQQEQLEEFWDSSMDVAKVAGAAAGLLKHCSRDLAYSVGLFHNCGIPLLMQKDQAYTDLIHQSYSSSNSIVSLEREKVGLDHALIGAKLCKLWNLNDKLCCAIKHHHDDNRVYDLPNLSNESKSLIAILQLSEHIAEVHRTLGRQTEDLHWEKNKKGIFERLGIIEDDYQGIRDEIVEQALNNA